MASDEHARFNPGDRVRISRAYYWAQGATGTGEPFPDDEPYRDVPAVRGMIRCYWVIFDEHHMDSDGDGPYSEAEIDEEYLELE